MKINPLSRRDFLILSSASLSYGFSDHSCAASDTLFATSLRHSLLALTQTFDGRVGIAVQDSKGIIAINGQQKFPLQSVMKLFVATAAMYAIDNRGWHLKDSILVRKQDLSLNVQPLAALVGDKGYSTTLGDLIFRAIVDSDSAATDVLFARVGGAKAIEHLLNLNAITGVRIDRDERHLQMEIVGLQWKPEYTDPQILERAKRKVSRDRRSRAFQASLKDARDTATPEGMTHFLYRLASGNILSPSSTAHLLNVMRETATFPNRLKAGLPAGWTIAHKTGTSNTWDGINGVTNDVGILTSPNNQRVAVSVFVAESRRTAEERAALIANVARIVTTHYPKK